MIANAVSQLEIRLALRLIALEDRAQALLNDPKIRQHMLAAIFAIVTVSLLIFARMALGSTGTAYAAAESTVEGLILGNAGKILMLLGVGWGAGGAMFKKDTWMFVQPALIAVALGLIVGVIDGEFSATV